MRRWRLRLALLPSTVVALTAGLVPLTAGPASALPTGYIYLLNYGDQAATGRYLGMDIADSCLMSWGPPGAGYVSSGDCTNEALRSQQWQTTVVK